MENEEKYKELSDKLEQELNEYKDFLKTKTPDEIIENSYKLVCMMGIQEYMLYSREYSKVELKTLLKSRNILEECYQTWLCSDGSLSEVLEYATDHTICLLKEDMLRKERRKNAR
ncbi:MAG: DUF3848 domain-containing protein [Clostridia bacterium]|nr:DUF3848 domain-containing protein [Clostridia bacterium]